MGDDDAHHLAAKLLKEANGSRPLAIARLQRDIANDEREVRRLTAKLNKNRGVAAEKAGR